MNTIVSAASGGHCHKRGICNEMIAGEHRSADFS
jgi:hypothetical protein